MTPNYVVALFDAKRTTAGDRVPHFRGLPVVGIREEAAVNQEVGVGVEVEARPRVGVRAGVVAHVLDLDPRVAVPKNPDRPNLKDLVPDLGPHQEKGRTVDRPIENAAVHQERNPVVLHVVETETSAAANEIQVVQQVKSVQKAERVVAAIREVTVLLQLAQRKANHQATSVDVAKVLLPQTLTNVQEILEAIVIPLNLPRSPRRILRLNH